MRTRYLSGLPQTRRISQNDINVVGKQLSSDDDPRKGLLT